MAEQEIAEKIETNERAPKIIKRYTNRKLYDTVLSKYVTLETVGTMVKDGIELQIIDNKTKEDITSITLAQIILEEEKKKAKTPLGLLREIVKTKGVKLHSFIADELNPRVSAIREGAEHAVAKVFRRTEGSDVTTTPDANAEEKISAKEQAREFVRSSGLSFEEWHKRLEERVHRAYETVAGLPSLHREVQALRDKLSELEKKLDEHR